MCAKIYSFKQHKLKRQIQYLEEQLLQLVRDINQGKGTYHDQYTLLYKQEQIDDLKHELEILKIYEEGIQTKPNS